MQESAPERLELKQALLAEACAAAAPGVLIASSTSGLRPTALAAEMARPGRFLVAHPFNPVYLLPLVELCAGERTAAETIARAEALYGSLGMAPLVVRKEIDGFVADRMLEALWREALWLVNDGVATVAEVDDAIRLAAGLRWSFMGTFLTYRIAGGEEGMRHFMAQFGPALQVAVDEADGRPGADRRAGRHDRRAVRRAGRGAAACASSSSCATTAWSRCCRRCARATSAPAPCSRGTSRRSRRRGARACSRDGDDLSQPLALHTRAGRARLGRLQRPRAREPLPAGLRRRLRRALRLPRHRRRVPRGAAATSRSRAISRTCARRCSTTASRSRRRCSTATRAGCTSSTRSGARATARCSRPPSSSTCTSTPSRGARRRRHAAVLARVQRIAQAHAALPRPERAGRSIGIPR